MKVAFIGCVQISETLLRRLLTVPQAEVVGVITRTSSPVNSDHRSLVPVAEHEGLPHLVVQGNDQEPMVGFLREVQPDVTYCFGWSYLLGRGVLDAAPLGVVGYHPAELPQNRGRHPLIWALALGLERTASTFFLMDEGADSGPIVDQVPVPIAGDDDAASLYEKISLAAGDQVARFTPALAAGTLEPRPQDHAETNTWRRRGPDDGRLDWRMSSDAIYNLVRALTRPYVGAHIEHDDRDVKVWRCLPSDAGRTNDEPGKVLDVQDRHVVVRCYGGAVRLTEHEFDPLPQPGDYL